MKIKFKDKETLTTNKAIPREQKVTAEDINEIKQVVNTNADGLGGDIEVLSNLEIEEILKL